MLAWLVAAVLSQPMEPRVRDGWPVPKDAKPAGKAVGGREARAVGKTEVVPLEWADLRHPEALEVAHFDAMFFSRGSYFGGNRARQQVSGSVADWLSQCSYDAAAFEGRSHQWVTSERRWEDVKKGMEEAEAVRLLAWAITRAAERDGEDRFDEAAAVVVMYMGSGAELPAAHPLRRRTVEVPFDRRHLRVTVIESGLAPGDAMPRLVGVTSVAREIVRGLGATDHRGYWCTMRDAGTELPAMTQANDHRPVHLCGPCKMKLGWLKPATLDPRVRQRIALRPVERFADAIVLPIVPDGSEHYLLENRQRFSFDRGLPAAGLLIWRVRGEERELIEAHGLPQKDASWKFPWQVPWPTLHATAFGPATNPSSRRGRPGELPVAVAGIELESDGVAYAEIAGAGAEGAAFEGERYTVVPRPPAVGTQQFDVRVALVEFADSAHEIAEPGRLREFFFEPGPRVPVKDAQGEVGRLSNSASDWFFHASGGAVSVRGTVGEWTKIEAKRAEVARLTGAQREKEFFSKLGDFTGADALVIVVAGAGTPPALVPHAGKIGALPYVMIMEGAASRELQMVVSVVLRAAGLEGRSGAAWCCAGNTRLERNLHFPGPTLLCAWCRMRLGWLKPFEIAEPGRFALSPSGVVNHAARIPIKEGEYYLIENRARWEFERALGREGLMIWHVTPPEAKCTSCFEGGILDVWMVHDATQAQAQQAQRFEPFQSLPRKALSLRLSDGKTEITGIKADARQNLYFEVTRTEP